MHVCINIYKATKKSMRKLYTFCGVYSNSLRTYIMYNSTTTFISYTTTTTTTVKSRVYTEAHEEGGEKEDLRQDWRSWGSEDTTVLIWDCIVCTVCAGTEGYCLVALDWGDGGGRE